LNGGRYLLLERIMAQPFWSSKRDTLRKLCCRTEFFIRWNGIFMR
jgi:hypothetical protein